MSRGEELLAKAKKISGKKSLFNKTSIDQKTADALMQAANAFRADRDFIKAGEVYMDAYKTYTSAKEKMLAAKAVQEAAKMFLKQPETQEQALESLKIATDIFKGKNKPADAANMLVEQSRILIGQDKVDNALENLFEAVELFQQAGLVPQAARFLQDIAELLWEKKEYQKSSECYLRSSDLKLTQTLTQNQAGILFLHALYCYLVINDRGAIEQETKKFMSKFPTYQNDRIYKTFWLELLQKIDAKVIEDYDEFINHAEEVGCLDKQGRDLVYIVRHYADPDDDTGLC